tara:strand:+ start:1077 stop:1337 length:261 start_codon:yes stop_codon:yes gene_type:complete
MNKAANDMKIALKTQAKSGYLKWIESLNESDLQEFNIIELQGIIKELVGFQLRMDPEDVVPWYINKAELQGQIVTTINLINRLETK